MMEVIEGASSNIEVGHMKPDVKFVGLTDEQIRALITTIEKEKRPLK